MPVKLSTTISKIKSLSNSVNSLLISELCDYMKKNGLSESHINNTLKTNMLFSEFLCGDISFYDVKGKEEIINFLDSNPKNPSIQLASLAALHKPNVTLSSYYDIVPYLTATGQRQAQAQTQTQSAEAAGHTRMDIIENCQCRLNGGFAIRHSKCLYCLHVWCPKAAGQDW